MHDDSLKLKSHLIVEIIVNPIHKNELILTALEEKIERMIKQREAKQNQGIWCAPPPPNSVPSPLRSLTVWEDTHSFLF